MTLAAVTLRSAGARDVDAVDALMACAFDPRFGEAWTRSQCLGVLALPGVRLTLAEVDDRPGGFALVRSVADEAELLLLAVAPDARRRGIGGALIRAVLAQAAQAGIVQVHLEVRASNPAVRLYRRHGFRQLGVRRGYYKGKDGSVHDAHTYGRDIGG